MGFDDLMLTAYHGGAVITKVVRDVEHNFVFVEYTDPQQGEGVFIDKWEVCRPGEEYFDPDFVQQVQLTEATRGTWRERFGNKNRYYTTPAHPYEPNDP